MQTLHYLLDFILHLDTYLFVLIQEYGTTVYLILFAIIFIETGLVLMPILPGDSLLFAAGTFCAGVSNAEGQLTQLNLGLVLVLLIVAAILGDALNYVIGKKLGQPLSQLQFNKRRLIQEKHLDQTHAFFEKHGPKTIILARFVPIIRTFAPFVAGLGQMSYRSFLKYNVIGAVAWVLLLTLSGYFFGNIPLVRENFELVVFGIIGLSLLPMLWAYLKNRLRK
ncbi:MAG: hypothetical protein RLZZ301_1242 [Bacteroidota bacterium]|jgi:membrane-associated protein